MATITKISNSTLEKRPIALLIFKKIKDKSPFEIDGKEVVLKFNPDIKGIDKLYKKNVVDEIVKANKLEITKRYFVGNGGPYKLTDLDKTEEFGGGSGGSSGGSGGGADNTAITESMQCYYNALAYHLKKDLNNKNATVKALKSKNISDKVYVYNKSTRLSASMLIEQHHKSSKVKKLGPWIEFDESGQNIYTKTANALRKHQKWSGVPYFHRGSPFMKAIYDSKELAMNFDKKQEVRKAPASGYSDDKWNPGDIWMSTYDPNPTISKPLDYSKGGKSCNLTFEMLKKDVQKEADKKRLLGVSLKKVETTATVTEYNLPKREQNINVTLKGFRFGQTGDFFNSTDVYLIFNQKEMQFRSFNSTKSWQGEVKGSFAAGGKIGGGGVNFYCTDILGRPIGTTSGDSMKWSETKWNDVLFSNFHKLYEKYSVHKSNAKKISSKDLLNLKEFTQEANRYTAKGKNAAPAFKFSKYMGLLMLESIYGKGNSRLNEWASEVLRYAMSNIDISSYFIKIE